MDEFPGPRAEVRPLVLIPAYKPEGTLRSLVEQLCSRPEIAGVVVVDDGDGPEFRAIFDALALLPRVHRLAHVVNLGKGSALKTGLNYIGCEFPGSVGVVTADADGQHAAEDILRVAKALMESPRSLILGVRGFDANVPFRSKFGNTLTRTIMRAVTGQKLADTQSGLRGIPTGFIPHLMRLRATGYDFELDMLVTCREAEVPIRQVPIETIYIDNNRSSHFNPLRDSMRIYFVFVRFAAVSLMTAALDNAVFIAGLQFLPSILLCQVISRLTAGLFQFTAARKRVFHSNVPISSALPRFLALVLFSGALSYVLIQTLLSYTQLNVIAAKLSAESVLFVISFVLQRDLVFTRAKGTRESVTS